MADNETYGDGNQPNTPDDQMGGNDDGIGNDMGSGDGNDATTDEVDPNAAAGTSDGFIGSRRIRTFLIGGLLIAYSLFAMITYFKSVSAGFGGFAGFAYVLSGLGLLVIIFSAAAAIILHCLNKEGGIETIVGWVLLGGSVTLLVGQIFLMFVTNKVYPTGAAFFIFVGQGTLGGVTGIFLALDVIKDFMAKEERRLFYNLLVLAFVSFCCIIGYSALSGSLRKSFKVTKDALAAIGLGIDGNSGAGAYALLAVGYTLILGFSIAYVILNFFDRITCNCDDNCFVRLLLAGGLIGGGVLTAIGYFAASNKLQWGESLGYAILVCGLSVVWGLDMGIVDTVTGGKKNTSED